MARVDEHGARVDAWMERSLRGLSLPQVLDAFEKTFTALWRRAHRTLGAVTLMAIVDRVLYDAAEQFPAFSTLRVDAEGLQFKELRQYDGDLQPAQVGPAIRFVLVRFLTLLGNLTADVLTPALHAEFEKVETRGNGTPNTAHSRGSGT